MEMFETLFDIFGIISVVTFLGIILYLRFEKKISFTQMGFNPLWPALIGEYKSYTKQKNGRIGNLYYIFIFSILITVLSFISMLVTKIF